MRHGSTLAVLVLSMSFAPAAMAAGKRSAGLTNAGPIGSGQSALYATAGWPGLTAGYLHGLSDTLDAGARVSFAYGCQGVPSQPCTGLELAADLKVALPVSGLPGALLFRFQPGLSFFGAGSISGNVTAFSLELPLELLMSFPGAMPQLTWHAGLQVPFAVGLNSTAGFTFFSMQIPVWLGGGGEYAVTPQLSVHGQLHLGPHVGIFFGGSTLLAVGFDSLLGVTYRF